MSGHRVPLYMGIESTYRFCHKHEMVVWYQGSQCPECKEKRANKHNRLAGTVAKNRKGSKPASG